MIEKLSLLGIGAIFGIFLTVLILRKDIIQFVNYHHGLPDLTDVEDVPAADCFVEKNARLKNLHIHLNRAENGVYPEGYEQVQAEIISALKYQIQALNGCGDLLEKLALDIAQESSGLKLE